MTALFRPHVAFLRPARTEGPRYIGAWSAVAAVLIAFVLLALVAGRARVAAGASLACIGDVNGDTQVNSLDLQAVAVRYGPSSNPAYNAQYDLNHDTNINSLDLRLVAIHFGTCPVVTIYVSNLMTAGTPVSGFGPFERDRSNGESAAGDGGPLTIGGVVYGKGFGTHAASDLRFAVPAGCTTFAAQVGLDDEVGSQGSVQFEVWDGTSTRLYQSAVLTGTSAPAAVSVGIAGVTTLRLVVLAGASDAFDHADWGDAKLLCTTTDDTAPLISGVGATPGVATAAIVWTTNEIADSQVEYGLTAAYGSTTALAPLLVAAHSVEVGGLTAGTLYHYRVVSRDPAGNVATGTDQTFTTTASLFGAPASFGAGTSAHSVVIADVNGDTKADLVTANAGANTVSVLIGNGAGSFAGAVSYATGSQPKSVAAGDFNGDTKLDLVTANQGTSNVSVLLGNGNGTFQPKADVAACTNSHEATIADLNGDTKMDIACAGWGASFAGVLLGNGSGGFAAMVSYAVGAAPHSIVAGYFNAGTALDLAVANHDSGSISVLIGNGNGTFQAGVTYGAGSGPHSIRAGDLNGDTFVDLVSANNVSDDVSVFMGNGDGTFDADVLYATGDTPKGVAIADIDGDGDLDVLTANINGNYPSLINPGGDSVSVLLGNGSGTLQARTEYAVGQGSFAVAVGRVNGDLKLDIATANWWDANVTVRLNTGP